MKCLPTNRAIGSALLSQIPAEEEDSGGPWHPSFLLLINASLHKTGILFKTCLNSCCSLSSPSNHSLPCCDLTVGWWGKYYDPVVHVLLFNQAIKHQYWLTSHQKLLNKLLVKWQQGEALADGLRMDMPIWGTLMRVKPTLLFTTWLSFPLSGRSMEKGIISDLPISHLLKSTAVISSWFGVGIQPASSSFCGSLSINTSPSQFNKDTALNELCSDWT